MANKSKFLKNLLTTASTLAVLAGGVQTAAAAAALELPLVAVGVDLTASQGGAGGFDPLGVPGVGATNFTDGSSVVLLNAGNLVAITVGAGNRTLGGLNLNARAFDDTLDVNGGDLVFGSVINNNALNGLVVTVQGNKLLTLNGVYFGGDPAKQNKYEGIKSVELNGANAKITTKLAAAADVTFDFTIDGAAPNEGIFSVLSGGANTHTFKGKIGNANSLKTINIGENEPGAAGVVGKAIFNEVVKSQNIQIGGSANAANAGGVGDAQFDSAVHADNFLVGGDGAVGAAGAGGDAKITSANLTIATKLVLGGAGGAGNGGNNGGIAGNVIAGSGIGGKIVITAGDFSIGGAGGDGEAGGPGNGEAGGTVAANDIFAVVGTTQITGGGITIGGKGGAVGNAGNGGKGGAVGDVADNNKRFNFTGNVEIVDGGENVVIGGAGGAVAGAVAGNAGNGGDARVEFTGGLKFSHAANDGKLFIGGAGGAGAAAAGNGTGGNGGDAYVVFGGDVTVKTVNVGGDSANRNNAANGSNGGAGTVIFTSLKDQQAGLAADFAVVNVGGTKVAGAATPGVGTVIFDNGVSFARSTFKNDDSVVYVGYGNGNTTVKTDNVGAVGNMVFDFGNIGGTIYLGRGDNNNKVYGLIASGGAGKGVLNIVGNGDNEITGVVGQGNTIDAINVGLTGDAEALNNKSGKIKFSGAVNVQNNIQIGADGVTQAAGPDAGANGIATFNGLTTINGGNFIVGGAGKDGGGGANQHGQHGGDGTVTFGAVNLVMTAGNVILGGKGGAGNAANGNNGGDGGSVVAGSSFGGDVQIQNGQNLLIGGDGGDGAAVGGGYGGAGGSAAGLTFDTLSWQVGAGGKIQIGGKGGAGVGGGTKGGAGGAGVVAFTGNVVSPTNFFVGGDAGNPNGIANSSVGGDGTVTFGTTLTKQGGAGQVALSVGGADNGVVAGGTGIVNFNGAGQSKADITFNNAKSSVNINNAGANVTGAFDFNGKDATVTFGPNGGTITGNVDNGVGAGGKLVFNNGANAATITGQIGANNALTSATFNNTGKGVAAAILDTANAGVQITTVNIDGTGEVIVGGTLTTGAGPANGVIFNAAGILTLQKVAGKDAIAGGINFNGQDGVVNVVQGANVNGDVITNVANTGKIIFAGAGANSTIGQVGVGNAIGLIKVDGGTVTVNNAGAGVVNKVQKIELNAANSVITLKNDAIIGSIVNTSGVVAGKLEFGTAGTIGNIGTAAANGALAEVSFGTVAGGGDINLNGDSFATTFKYYDVSNVTTTGKITGNVDFNNSDGSLSLKGALPVVTGNITDATNNNKGELIVSAAGQLVKGTIGDANGGINKITFDIAVPGASLTVDSGAVDGLVRVANGVEFNKADQTLGITGTNKDQAINGNIIANTDGDGNVNLDVGIGFANKVTFNGKVGDAAVAGNGINSLTIGAGVGSKIDGANTSYVSFEDDVNIKNFIIDGKTNIMFGTGGGKTYKIGEFSGDGFNGSSANLVVAGDTTLLPRGDGLVFTGDTLIFGGDHKFTIGDGVNINAVNGVQNATANGTGKWGGGPNQGTLEFLGNSVFNAKMTANDTIKAIDASAVGANKVLRIEQDVFTNEDILGVGAGGTLVFGEAVTTINVNGGVKSILGNSGGAGVGGTLKFENGPGLNGAGLSVNAKVGDNAGAALFEYIEFAGSNPVTFNNQIFVGATVLKFTSASNISVSQETEIGKLAVNVANNVAPIINVKAVNDKEFSSKVTGGDITYNLTTSGGNVLIKSDGYASALFTVDHPRQNNLEMQHVNATIRGVGSKDNIFRIVQFKENGTITAGTYSDNVTVDNGKIARFGGEFGSVNTLTLGANSGARFTQKGLTFSAKTTNDTTSTMAFDSDVKIAEGASIGGNDKMASVSFGGAVNLGKSSTINSANTSFGTNLVTLDGDATLSGGIVGISKVNVNSSKLAVNSGVNLKVEGSGSTITSEVNFSNGLNGGSIVLDNKSSVTYDKTLNIVVNGTVNPFDTGEYVLLSATQKAVFLNGVVTADAKGTNNNAGFIKWTATVDPTNGSITIRNQNATRDVLRDNVTKATASGRADQNTKDIAEVLAGNREIVGMLNSMNPDRVVDAINALKPEAEVVQNTASNNLDQFTSLVNQRMGALEGSNSPRGGTQVVDSGTGVAAGEDDARYGAWLTPFYNRASQKASKGTGAYTAETSGAGLGFDTKVNDDMIVGAAISFVNSDISYKGFKPGDNAKLRSLMFSIYGVQQINANWFTQGIVTFGSNNVSTNQKRLISQTESLNASGKYTSMSFSAEALVGYNYSNMRFSVTPMAGFRLTRVNDAGYTETGAGIQNLSVNRKALNKAELVFGGRVSGNVFDIGSMSLAPELHGFVNYDFIAKDPKTTASLNQAALALPVTKAKPAKATYNAGFGVNTEYGMMEYGVGYDMYSSKKYIAHQGTLKVRVNF